MQLTPKLNFSLTFFSKTNFLYKYPPREKVNFFKRKCPCHTQKSSWTDLTLTFGPSTLPEHTITLPERTSARPPFTTAGPPFAIVGPLLQLSDCLLQLPDRPL
ncbi:hypothetical protein AMTRI_Chr03g144230 [Amborella trichopoda]